MWNRSMLSIVVLYFYVCPLKMIFISVNGVNIDLFFSKKDNEPLTYYMKPNEIGFNK